MQSGIHSLNRRQHPTTVLLAASVLWFAVPSTMRAHHSGHVLSVPSARCGWIEGEDLRDRRNVADFCAQWVPAELRITNVSAARERLWIEAPADVASGLRGDNRTTAALLRQWLAHWKQMTGYRTASVSLVRQHVEFARVQTTMTDEVVVVVR